MSICDANHEPLGKKVNSQTLSSDVRFKSRKKYFFMVWEMGELALREIDEMKGIPENDVLTGQDRGRISREPESF